MRIKERFVFIFIILLVIGMVALISVGTKLEKNKYLKSHEFIQSEFDELSNYFSVIRHAIDKIDLKIKNINELYNVDINDGTCTINDGDNNSFVVNSYSSVCENTDSVAHMDLLQALAVTKIMLTNTPSNKFKSVYFISQKGFIISSSSSVAKAIKVDDFEVFLFQRPYILNVENKRFFPKDTFVITGPYEDFVSKENTITFTSKVYRGDRLIGYLNLDIPFASISKYMCDTCSISNEKINKNNLSLDIIVDKHRTDIFYEKDFSLTATFVNVIKEYSIYISFYILFSLLLCSQLNYSYQSRRRKYILNSSYLDELTGLLNRRGFNEKINVLKSAKCRTVAICDIDDFKNVNDKFGHLYGDYVIKEIANIFKQKIRDGDLICRFGGEEFVLVLSTQDANAALLILDRIRKKIESNQFYYEGSKSKVTISCGAAMLENDNANSHELFNSALEQADKHLYRAKSYGKNYVILENFKL